VTRPDRISIGLRLASLSLPYTHLCIFINLSCHVVCFSHGFLLRFWHSLHISSHSMVFAVSSFVLLSFCAFRILEYLVIGIFFWDIVHDNPFLSVCWAYLDIFYALWIAALLIFFFGIHLTAILNTTLFLELTGSNGIFGDMSSWFGFRNMTSSGSQHNVWQMDPLENWLLLKSDVQNSKGLRIKMSFSPCSCRAFRSIPSDLYQLEVQWWISSFILQTSSLEDVNLRITSFRLCKIKRLKVF